MGNNNNNKRVPVNHELTEEEYLDDNAFFGNGANKSADNFVYDEEFLEDDEGDINVFDDTEYSAQGDHLGNNSHQAMGNNPHQTLGQGSNGVFQDEEPTAYQNYQGNNQNYQGSNPNGTQNSYQNYQNSNNGQQDIPATGSSRKKIGIIVFAVLVIIALALVFFSKIKITHDDATKQQGQTNNQQTQQAQQTTQASQDTLNADAKKTTDLQKSNDDLEKKVQDLQDKLDAKNAEEEASNKANASSSKSSGGKLTIQQDKSSSSVETSDWQEVNGSAIDYSSQLLKSSGQVASKKVFLNNSGQLVYVLEISARLNGVSTSSVEYYCGYDAFNSVSESENIDISYKKINNDVFAILGVYKK